MKIVYFISFLFLLATNAFAGWDPGAIQWAQSFEDPTEGFSSSEGMTTWMVAKSYGDKLTCLFCTKGVSELELKSPYFETEKFHISLSLRKNWFGRVQVRPLIVFLPGVFGGLESPSVFRAIQNFASRGFHVLALPNPWSLEYINNLPLKVKGQKDAQYAEPGELDREALVVLDIVGQVKEDYIPHGAVSKTLLVGESYGGLLALVTGAEDDTVSPIIDGPITMFGPPLDVGAALKGLDQGYLQTKEPYKEECKNQELRLTLKYYMSTEDSSWDSRMLRCASSLVYQGFHKNLVASAHALKELRGLVYEVSEDLQFQDFVRLFTPNNEVELRLGEKTNLLYWIKKYPLERRNLLRIMTSNDDFLNRKENLPVINRNPLSWDLVKDEMSKGIKGKTESSVLVLPWGGHIGFVGLKRFQELINISFSTRFLDYVLND